MKLIDCTSEYWEFVRLLRTNSENTTWFYTQPNISVEGQIEYMSKNSNRYKICLLDNQPVGYVGIIGENEITYCVKPEFKNKGIGSFMVTEFMKTHDELIAYVIPNNISSCKVFEKLNFNKQIYYSYKKK
jgi:RimJ/RimL family protein N-acetyltransferase